MGSRCCFEYTESSYICMIAKTVLLTRSALLMCMFIRYNRFFFLGRHEYVMVKSDEKLESGEIAVIFCAGTAHDHGHVTCHQYAAINTLSCLVVHSWKNLHLNSFPFPGQYWIFFAKHYFIYVFCFDDISFCLVPKS